MHQGVLTLQCGQGVDTAVNVKLMKTCHGSYNKNPKKKAAGVFFLEHILYIITGYNVNLKKTVSKF